jgi:hypothetical protein
LQGTANLAGLGTVTVSGAINNVVFFSGTHAEGQLTFTDNQNNSVTLDVRGPWQQGFAPMPQQLEYRVTGGTGAWANLSGQGTLTLVLQSQSSVMTGITIPIGALPAKFLGELGQQGTFTLSLSADSGSVDSSWWDTPSGAIEFHPIPVDPPFPVEPPLEGGPVITIDPILITLKDPIVAFGRADTIFALPTPSVPLGVASSIAFAR